MVLPFSTALIILFLFVFIYYGLTNSNKKTLLVIAMPVNLSI